MRSRTCPSVSSGPHSSRAPRCGMFPYGAWPSRILLAPATPARPTSITPRGVSTLRPIRNPRRKIAAAASSQVGQSDRSGDPFRPPGADPEPASQEVEENRIDEGHASEDLAAVEEHERDREREQHEQIDVVCREGDVAGRRDRPGTPGRRQARRTARAASCHRTPRPGHVPSSRRPEDPSRPLPLVPSCPRRPPAPPGRLPPTRPSRPRFGARA